MATETKTKKAEKAPKTTKKTESKASNKFAVIVTGGKQYVVREGDVFKIELVDSSDIKSGKITFDEVLLIDDGKETKIGTPTVSGAKVVAEVLHEDVKEKKVLVMRFKSKSNYKKKNGHRQRKTIIKISEIK
jgi:large subunit ribosomal protein L21